MKTLIRFLILILCIFFIVTIYSLYNVIFPKDKYAIEITGLRNDIFFLCVAGNNNDGNDYKLLKWYAGELVPTPVEPKNCLYSYYTSDGDTKFVSDVQWKKYDNYRLIIQSKSKNWLFLNISMNDAIIYDNKIKITLNDKYKYQQLDMAAVKKLKLHDKVDPN